ncbi:MAG TPA: hypothetical protein VMU98_01080, partial [Acidimicrobiales bacterium]|nr:hypothetical protein [Acidimicrobiales bacterium]
VPGSLVTVVTGTGLTFAPAQSSTSSTTTSVKKTTPTLTTTTLYDPAGIKSNPLFTAPTATNSAPAPWDPRACNATGSGPA